MKFHQKDRILEMMKNFRKHAGLFLIAVTILMGSQTFGQGFTSIGEGLHGVDLFNYLISNYKTSSTLGYNKARDTMYAVIDILPGNQVRGVYSGYTVTLNPNWDPSSDLYNKGISCEHTWPKSMGAYEGTLQYSDIHNLYPTRNRVNMARSNYPFAEIDDQLTDKWFRGTEERQSIPSSNIDEYSELESDSPKAFEPREDHKGNVARSMFYFYTMYYADASKSFWNKQKDILFEWHYADPVDSVELKRSWKIAEYQDGIPNPFVVDTSIARRIWFYNETAVEEEPLAESFQLLPNHPNPFNHQTVFEFVLPEGGKAELLIYNVIGQQIETIASDYYGAGYHRVIWHPKVLESGIYLYRLQYNGRLSDTGKCILLK